MTMADNNAAVAIYNTHTEAVAAVIPHRTANSANYNKAPPLFNTQFVVG